MSTVGLFVGDILYFALIAFSVFAVLRVLCGKIQGFVSNAVQKTNNNILRMEGKVCFATPIQPVPGPAQPPPGYYAQGQGYEPPQPTSYIVPDHTAAAPLRVGQYIVMFLLMCVPILNVILLFKWSFGRSVNPGRKNFARASLILWIVAMLVILIGGGGIMGALGEIMNGFY